MYLGVDYYPEHWDENMIDEDLDNIIELGSNVIRIGEFAWHMMENVEGNYDFSYFDRVIKKAKEKNIHTCLDTSGFVDIEKVDKVLDYTDLVLLDFKHMIEEEAINLTGVGIEKTIKLAKHLDERNIPIWFRHVLVPGVTDSEENLSKIGEFAATLNNIDRLEILPYHTMGVHKWENMGLTYDLKDVRDANDEDVARAAEIIERYGVKVFNKKK